MVASLFERRAPGLYHNTAAILDADGALLGIYRKMHIPDDPLYYEKFYFTPGDTGFLNFDTKHGAYWDTRLLGPMVSGRRAALQPGGASVLFYPTAIGWHPSEKEQYGAAQLDAWRTIQRAHAIANGIYVCAVNRVGFEGPPDDGLEFWGSFFVADPFGQVIAQASADKEEVLVVECDPARWTRCDATGRFFATGASMLMVRSPTGGLVDGDLSDAGRVGAPRGHLARMAAREVGLAGQISANSLGLCRNCEAAGEGRASSHSG